MLDQFWVGPSDESALERIWGSFDEDRLVRFVEAHPGKWEECIDRGAELTDIKPYRDNARVGTGINWLPLALS